MSFLVQELPLWAVCGLLFLDGATLAAFTTPIMLVQGRHHEPWLLAAAGGSASALGSALQFYVLKRILGGEHRWLRRFAPSRARLAAALERYRSASFVALLVARATPISDGPVKLVAAAGGYPVRNYLAAILLGGLPYYFALALLGRKVSVPPWILVGLILAVVAAFVVDQVRAGRRSRA